MYRLVLYYLIILLVIAIFLGAVGVLFINPFSIIVSSVFFIFACWITNSLFSYIFEAHTNVESVYITALILALIISPPENLADTSFFSLAIWASVWAMASKYILAIRRKHIFNPAAFAVVLTALAINQSASWWVGTNSLAIPVLIGGLLVVRKIRRSDMIFSFFVVALATILAPYIIGNSNILIVLQRTFLSTSILFFAFVMLTEPLTTPPTANRQMIYGAIVGLLFAPSIHIGPIYSTPELALVVGNIFSYLVSPKNKLLLALKNRIEIGKNTYDFVFGSDRKMLFNPGQYMEWTLSHKNPDNRGNRRYFTLSSSPTESDIKIGVKFYTNPSSFKEALISLNPGDTIYASQLSGDFIMPKNPKEKLVFIAGGIGVTPFRSMIKYLLDTNEKRSITMLYACRTEEEVAYRGVFDLAEKVLGVKMVYIIAEKPDNIIPGLKIGTINSEMIKKEVPDYQERTFYISGPNAMVRSFKSNLREMGVAARRIKTDFFPGFV